LLDTAFLLCDGSGFSRLLKLPEYQEAQVKLSARNQLAATVTSINQGEAIANVVLDVAGQRLVASITVEAVADLGLREGSDVTAIIKASDVIIATGQG
jgi:molybdopterin-binding protein